MISSSNGTYTYDGHNRRVIIDKNNSKTYSMYNQAGVLVYQYTPSGPMSYIRLGNKLVAKDGVETETSSDSKLHYKPFGETIETAKSDIGYTGHKYDADLGLNYMQARYYDPVIGRFYSNDPVGYSNVHNFSRYTYANNNPYKFVDPDGQNALLATCFAGPLACGAGIALTIVAIDHGVKGTMEAVNAQPGVVQTPLRDGENASEEELANSDNPDDETAGVPLSNSDRERFWEEYEEENDEYTCWRCGYQSDDKDEFDIGHRNKPRSHGGTKHKDNLDCEGRPCNRSSGNRGEPKTSCWQKQGITICE